MTTDGALDKARDKDTVFEVVAEAVGEHGVFDVFAELHHVRGGVVVSHAHDVLLDDRAGLEFLGVFFKDRVATFFIFGHGNVMELYAIPFHHSPDFTMEMDAWPFHKICRVAIGQGKLEHAADAIEIEPDDFLIVPAGCRHRFLDRPGEFLAKKLG